MKVGIDCYCYHQFFGEVYPDQRAPAESWTLERFIARAVQLGVDGVSLESCFIPRFDGEPVTSWHFFACTPVGDGFVDNLALAGLLKDANYKGFLAVEIDFLHPDYREDEDAAVAHSIPELKRVAAAVG